MPNLRQRKQEERFKTKGSLHSVQNVAAGFAQGLQKGTDGDGAEEQTGNYAVDRLEERAAGVIQRATPAPEQAIHRTRSTSFSQKRMETAREPEGKDTHLPHPESSHGKRPDKSSLGVKARQAHQPGTKSQSQQFRQMSAVPCRFPGTAAQCSASNRSAEQARKKYTQSAQKKMSQQTQKASRKAASLGKKAATAIIRTVGSAIGLLAGSFGGVVLLLLCFTAFIVAVAASPMGIFFSSGSSADSVPLASAVAQVNMEYSARLALLQMEPHDRVEILGQAPDWCDVIAVFACEIAGKDDGMDVTTLDSKRVEKLSGIFWNMCSLSSATQVIAHPDSDREDEVDDSWEETVLYITVSARTVDEMRLICLFNDYQNDALDTLLANKAALRDLLGNLDAFQEDALALLRSLSADLSPGRETVVRHALSLVGKVNYFWGGKSRVLGWDSRWGQLQLVWAEGSETTGSYRPFGLDCSGFVDWVFYNASDGEYLIGHGGGVYEQHTFCTDIHWEEVQPGDLVFFADDSHVGIVGGWDEDGNLLVIHCGSGANCVVIEEVDEAGFAVAGRPVYFQEASSIAWASFQRDVSDACIHLTDDWQVSG